MNDTTYTITATRYDGAVKYVRHDMTENAARGQVAQLEAYSWDNITTDPMLPEDAERVAAAIAQKAHDKAVCCAVVGVCVIAFIVATVLGFII